MTESHVEVVRINGIEKHPNADTLSLARIHGGYPVLFRTGEFNEGDLAVYIPVDSVVPDRPEWEFLGAGLRNHRIKAKKIRQIFSMGMLAAAPAGTNEGDNVAELLGIRRYEDVVGEATQYKGASRTDGLEVPAPRLACMPSMYDIEGWRKYGSRIFSDPTEDVVVTEKIHGQNFRAVSVDGVLHAGSRTRWLSTDPETNTWAKVAARYGLAEKLAAHPGLVLFGESYGNNSDMPYGVKRFETGDALAVFDAWDSNRGEWLAFDDLALLCSAQEPLPGIGSRGLGLPMAPVLYRGPLGGVTETLASLAEGKTTLGADHVREGWVIKPAKERRDDRIGRVALKLAGESYLTRKGG